MKIISPILWTILFTVILGIGVSIYFIHEVARDSVHGNPPVSYLKTHVANRIAFPERGSATVFDSALTEFMDQHPNYKVPEIVFKNRFQIKIAFA
jgi:hypothetical protein